MPSYKMYYLFDLFGYSKNVIQYEDGLITTRVEKFQNLKIHCGKTTSNMLAIHLI